MEKRIVGVCGYGATGSSAFIDLLHEFDETHVLDTIEFRLAHLPDGLDHLEYYLMNNHITLARIVAIRRFRELIKKLSFKPAKKRDIKDAANVFLNKLIQFSYNGNSWADMYMYSPKLRLMVRLLEKSLAKFHLYTYHKQEESIMPKEFDEAAKVLISDILNAMSEKSNCIDKTVTVLDQPFLVHDPVRNFKFFENPMAIIVDRDPRDLYLCFKYFYPMNIRYLPCDNVDAFINHFRLLRRNIPDLRGRKDVIYFNFEELVYDSENTTKKIADFVRITAHTHKGKYFNPNRSRNNTQLFKKYTGCEADIKKIEHELPEYLFPFEKYHDIESVGGMFY